MKPEIRNEHSERQIVTVRVFNASRETVFYAWTHPELLKQWWGPKGFTNTFHEFDLRTDGHWKFTMHGPDGSNYSNEENMDRLADVLQNMKSRTHLYS